jgi:ATP-dependent exoDNAse (exonuclease V) beta subunit
MQASADAITVSTIHKSKGLEYPAVIIPWLSWSLGQDTRGRQLVLWSRSGEEEGTGEHFFPINYKEAMAGSFFSARYWREQVLAHIDSVNLFYVAATRAERELHLMMPSNPRNARGTVGALLREALDVTSEFTEWGDPPLTEGGAVEKNTFGEAAPRKNGGCAEKNDGILRHYPTSRPGARIKLRLPQARYVDEAGAGPELSPRDLGVSMHRAMERADTAADVHRALERLAADGLISRDERSRLASIMERALADPLVGGWFSDDWETVRLEGDILLPGDAAKRRPDRVMIRGREAVVVDYKFGRLAPPSHAAQIREYMRLLREMGMTRVEGYLWYVSLERIERVE